MDLGTSFGITTAYLAKANQNLRITTFEGCPETLKIAQSVFTKLELKNIKPILGNINQTLPEALADIETLDFAFFDANHRKLPTIEYFEKCLAKKHENSCFVFDDIYWSEEMKSAWNEIKQHPEVSITSRFVFYRTCLF